MATSESAVTLAVSTVPSDLLCLQVTVTGQTRAATRSIATNPGQSLMAKLSDLPTGPVDVLLQGFPAVCTAVTPQSEPAWISDVLKLVLVRGVPTALKVSMRENGRINLDVDFLYDSPPTGSAPRLALCGRTTDRLGKTSYCVNQVPGASYAWAKLLGGLLTPLPAVTTNCTPSEIILAGTEYQVVATVAGVSSEPFSIPFATNPPAPPDPLCDSSTPDAGAPLLANGAACAAGSACGSGFCVSGVCCESACSGACLSCRRPGAEGACLPSASGIVCGVATCSGNAFIGASTCDAMGSCRQPTPVSCGAYVCAANACKTSCAADPDCGAGNYCSNGACVVRLAQGAPCTGSAQCASGFCVDGVCCNAACRGVCETCRAPTVSSGVCSPVPTGFGDPGTCDAPQRCTGPRVCGP